MAKTLKPIQPARGGGGPDPPEPDLRYWGRGGSDPPEPDLRYCGGAEDRFLRGGPGELTKTAETEPP